jgi:glycosyltransferase involved in cell wall biosynthesis
MASQSGGLRVAILSGIFPPDVGGPATSVPKLAASLLSSGLEVVVITLGNEVGERPNDPCPVVRIPRRLNPARRVAAVVRSVAHAHPDVVLANGLHIESACIPRVPVVQKIVGDWAWERARNVQATSLGLEEFQAAHLQPRLRALRSFRSFVTRRSRLVIVPSRYLGSVVRSWGVPETSVRVIPNAAPPIEQPARNGSRGNRALFVGRLVAWKHVDHVLRVLTRMPDLRLDIAGTGPEMESLQALTVALRLRERVVFLGALPRQEVLARMREAAFLVLPSSYEGMPHVVLEAFSQGLPVVASGAAGTPELVGDGVSGFLYPCGSIDGLAAAIQRAATPERAAMVIEGGRAVARRYSASVTAQATAEVLREAAA